MHLVRVTLPCDVPGPDSEREVAALTDALWAHAEQEDALEHIRCRRVDDRVELILFLRETSGRDPEESTVNLIARTYRGSAHIRTVLHLLRARE